MLLIGDCYTVTIKSYHFTGVKSRKNQMTKILFFQWHSFMNPGIEAALKKIEIDYDTYFYQFVDWEKDELFLERFSE